MGFGNKTLGLMGIIELVVYAVLAYELIPLGVGYLVNFSGLADNPLSALFSSTIIGIVAYSLVFYAVFVRLKSMIK